MGRGRGEGGQPSQELRLALPQLLPLPPNPIPRTRPLLHRFADAVGPLVETKTEAQSTHGGREAGGREVQGMKAKKMTIIKAGVWRRMRTTLAGMRTSRGSSSSSMS